VIFVHGCFWHLHWECREGRIPASRTEYWLPKLTGNRKRDQVHLRQLKRQHWRTLVIWECEIRDDERLRQRLVRFLNGPNSDNRGRRQEPSQ
jgi:DNA mismatch endonuclease, patch repair protein